MESVVNYLSELYHRDLAYNTINIHRSAISHNHQGIEGTPVGQHKLVHKLMLGIYNQNPPKPKYKDVWDVDIVLNFLDKAGDNAHLSDKLLTHKTAMLLALTTAARASELQALNLEFFVDRGDYIEFHLTKPTKTCRPGSKLRTFKIQAFSHNAKLDVVESVRCYVKRTAAWRTSSKQHALFLTTTGKHTPVAIATISGWLVKLMKDAGVDTSIYKGHSTRAASTSKAAQMGMSVQDIVQRANWTNARTFHRFYHRTSSDDDDVDFSNLVLSKH